MNYSRKRLHYLNPKAYVSFLFFSPGLFYMQWQRGGTPWPMPGASESLHSLLGHYLREFFMGTEQAGECGKRDLGVCSFYSSIHSLIHLFNSQILPMSELWVRAAGDVPTVNESIVQREDGISRGRPRKGPGPQEGVSWVRNKTINSSQVTQDFPSSSIESPTPWEISQSPASPGGRSVTCDREINTPTWRHALVSPLDLTQWVWDAVTRLSYICSCPIFVVLQPRDLTTFVRL